LRQIEELIALKVMCAGGLDGNRRERMRALKRKGFSDSRLAELLAGTDENAVRALRKAFNVRPVYKRVDSCAAEFATTTAYLYSTYEDECEAEPSTREKIMVLGGGPNRIGQGIEFDYCCVHAALALREDGYETIMVNCNPETVSTDYDTSDRLYFEPLTLEDVLEIVEQGEAEGRDRAVRRTDAAEACEARWKPTACRSSVPRRIRSTSPRTANASRS
jgi:carbamoyl-phosphate synthase large subunit